MTDCGRMAGTGPVVGGSVFGFMGVSFSRPVRFIELIDHWVSLIRTIDKEAAIARTFLRPTLIPYGSDTPKLASAFLGERAAWKVDISMSSTTSRC